MRALLRNVGNCSPKHTDLYSTGLKSIRKKLCKPQICLTKNNTFQNEIITGLWRQRIFPTHLCFSIIFRDITSQKVLVFTADFSDTSVLFYHIPWHHLPEDSSFYSRRFLHVNARKVFKFYFNTSFNSTLSRTGLKSCECVSMGHTCPNSFLTPLIWSFLFHDLLLCVIRLSLEEGRWRGLRTGAVCAVAKTILGHWFRNFAHGNFINNA